MFPDLLGQKISPISADKTGTVFSQPCTYLLTSITALCGYTILCNFLSWGHREQDAPDKKNKRKNKECEIRQESDLSIKYEKAQQDVGLFYCLSFLICQYYKLSIKYRL